MYESLFRDGAGWCHGRHHAHTPEYGLCAFSRDAAYLWVVRFARSAHRVWIPGSSRHLAVGTTAIDGLLMVFALGVLAEPRSDAYIGLALMFSVMVGGPMF